MRASKSQLTNFFQKAHSTFFQVPQVAMTALLVSTRTLSEPTSATSVRREVSLTAKDLPSVLIAQLDHMLPRTEPTPAPSVEPVGPRA